MRRNLPLALAILHMVAGCSGSRDGDEGRAAWLTSTLVHDNYLLLQRDPQAVAGKLTKMAASPYNMLRGTAFQFWRDATEPRGAAFAPTRYGSAAAARVVILGDPHLENVGTFRADDGTMLVDFNDFDIATAGPYHLDLRRLVASVGVTLAPVETLDSAQRRAALEAVARGYAREIVALSQGAAAIAIRHEAGFGTIIDDLLRRAQRDGEAREELDEYTRVKAGRRVMFFGDVETSTIAGVIADRTEPVTISEERLLHALLDSYPSSLQSKTAANSGALLGLARRLGGGVSSYPLNRYYALMDGPSTSPEDDVLLEIKEILDPLVLPALPHYPPPWFANTAQRVVYYQRQLQERADSDPLLGWAVSAPSAFRIRHRTKYQKSLGHERLAEKLQEGKWSAQDVVDVATVMGRLLARGHALARRRDGRRGLEAIAEALGGDIAGFTRESADAAEAYVRVLIEDHALLRRLLAEEGPLLGYTPR